MSAIHDHAGFLHGVSQYVEQHPSVAAYVSDAVSSGLAAAQATALERAADMEVALALSLGRNSVESRRVILNKLEKWKGRSSIPWDSAIQKLSAKGTP